MSPARLPAAAAAVAVLAVAVIVALSGAPVAWLLLGLDGAIAVAILVRAFWERRYFEPLTIVAGFALLSFVIRPLHLFANVEELASWYPTADRDAAALTLERSETAQFVTRRLEGDLEPALTRTTAAVTLFLVLFVAGWLLPVGRGLRVRLSRLGTAATSLNARAAVGISLAVGLFGQVLVLALAGGPVEAFEGQLDSKVLETGSPLITHFLMGFSTVAVLCWALWQRPVTRLQKLGFLVAVLEVAAFWALAGSRTRVLLLVLMLGIVMHSTWRPWSRRAVLAGIVGCLVVGTALLSVRQATADEPIGRALLSAPDYLTSPGAIVNDVIEYDTLLIALSVIPSERGYGYGQGAVDALAAYVPDPFIGDKPESTDREFRAFVWGDELKGGRPYTIVGDFYNDFGFPGIAVGALLFGIAGRLLQALMAAPAGLPGRRYRVGLFAVGAAIFYMALATAFTLPLGFLIELLLPFLIAVHVFGALGSRRGGDLDSLPAPAPAQVLEARRQHV